MNQTRSPARIDFDTPAMRRKRRWRASMDRFTRWYVLVGGLAVLAAITLIFFYLAYVVLPLFKGATLTADVVQAPAWVQQAGAPLALSVEEQNEVGMQVTPAGDVVFFRIKDGAELSRQALPIPPGTQVVSVARDLVRPVLALGLSNGRALLVRHIYKSTYPENKRVIVPQVDYPYGPTPVVVDPEGRALEHLSLTAGEGELTLAASNASELLVFKLTSTEDMLTGETTLEQQRVDLPRLSQTVQALHLDPRGQWLYVINGRSAADVFDLRDRTLNGHYKLIDDAHNQVTVTAQLLGGISLLVGDAKGGISQWFMARGKDGEPQLQRIRNFQLKDAPITQIVAEQRRKGFLALDEKGTLGIFHSTAGRTVLTEKVADGNGYLALSPRANHILLERNSQLINFTLDNPHPEISWSALWSKVWYENYEKPSYVWQSTSASNDSEPKLSLAPLTFGTLKAAFYAMLLAAPLAVAAAVYTAYFMAPRMRRKVKPVIELMEALPTVILGFFAGLFLAPYVEGHLPGIFSLLLLVPIGIVLAGFLWSRLPESIRFRLPDGWESLLLIPVVLLTGWFALSMSPHLETWWFNGDMRLWLHEHHITYDQRNALIVGLAMGFAIIPNIFSIAEDAIFSVPRSLTYGSLALGATPWQTLTRVVILTASPGIFSALMIGLGRAVGETMIVLMATGNTPIMNANIFEGMRTLAANVAVEMPESEVGGTHYRVLFLAALVLLSFTFVMNTLAEMIRHRLRKKYASL
jgi:phosphate transport system permease protein